MSHTFRRMQGVCECQAGDLAASKWQHWMLPVRGSAVDRSMTMIVRQGL